MLASVINLRVIGSRCDAGPDHLGWWSVHEGEVVEVGVLGDNDEVVAAGVLPNGAIGVVSRTTAFGPLLGLMLVAVM